MSNNDEYPLPKKPKLRLIVNTKPDPAFSGTREEWEEYVFTRADHFNIVRFGSHNGSESTTVGSFAEAIHIALNNPRALIYAACTGSGDAFCVARKDWEKFARITLERRSAAHGQQTD